MAPERALPWQAVASSPMLRAACVFGISGVAYAGANLLLARALSPREYGIFTLVVSLLYLGYSLGPLGADGAVNRRKLKADTSLLGRLLITSSSVALTLALASWLLYGFGAGALGLLLVGVVAGGAVSLAAAQYQSRQRFKISLVLSESGNFVLVAAALLAVLLGIERGLVPIFLLGLGWIGVAAFGWRKLLHEGTERMVHAEVFSWSDSLSYAFMSGAGYLLVQLERLVVPKVLSLEDLALFGVLAAIVIAPFRVLQMGVGYTLLPRLRAAASLAERRRLLAREAILVLSVAVLASLFLWLVAPRLVDWFLTGKYELSPSLLLVGLAAGLAKMLNGFVRAAVTALVDTRRLVYVSLFGWLAVGVALLGASVGAPWGLEGVVLGISAGWVLRAAASGLLVAPYLSGSSEPNVEIGSLEPEVESAEWTAPLSG